jgi:polyribonucleotide nucleotidyltransferase
MFEVTKKSIEWGGRTLTLETGKIARQADGAVIATYGETVVLCTVVGKKQANPDADFFPLTVDFSNVKVKQPRKIH